MTPPTLTVSGRLVQTDSHTRIRSHDQTISLSDVKPGNVVEVEGQASGGAVLAQSINVEDGGDEKD